MNTAATPTLSVKNHRRLAVFGVISLLLFLLLSTCSPRTDQLQQIKATGVLRISTVNSPTTYYIGAAGPLGFEYELAKGFAESLNAGLEVVVASSPAEAIQMAREGRVHFAAAGLAITPEREKTMRFSPAMLRVVPQLVYRMGETRPDNLDDLEGTIRVQRGSIGAELLSEAKKKYPDLKWEETDDQETEELLYQVANNQLGYTIANSDIISINQRYYPRLRVAFAASKSQDLAWAFQKSGDNSLFDAANAYLEVFRGVDLPRLRDRYFGHIEQVNYMGAVTLASMVQTRLTRYRKAFEDAAEKHQLDWRLLAAMGYQESHWDEDAVSPTGVKGLMMLTLDTADFLNVRDREDPVQSIFGGARYFRQLLEQLPPEIKEPDRTWMGLAAYNIGIGHVFDARSLTRSLGGNPNHWLDVRNSLPLLTQERWYMQTKHGYARGYETVAYVGNVRTYYDMLSWITNVAPGRGQQPELEQEPPLQTPAGAKKHREDPLHINSPIL
ncbi:membrane-bound lytic murein transglycosylase MltF [Stenotrophobium rhamnosiphilum]|uniref:Membrane-bound lytic murein transglycosylase F n=1 Tax=Stenotrophobium rhamnosiphilum TaxID=2029166 RepID=A0A2T5MDK3_9GAMM|nr:membrane-bound lytic murein transglycosylase MltF [Stenotrophobium rhamnosiphilum]PTU30655.1 membrane-bound lytic murein transglycosylase MltF [Stenotrophobium rhamnosiphilum]